MDGEDQPAAAHISAMDTPLDHTQDEAMPLVEWALTPMGHCWPKEEYSSVIASIIHLDSLLCDRRPFGAAAKAYTELFKLPKRHRMHWFQDNLKIVRAELEARVAD